MSTDFSTLFFTDTATTDIYTDLHTLSRHDALPISQDVPISITVLDQQQLANANVTNSSDLANYTPSLSVNTRFGAENAMFAIRGFTQDLRTTASVATYFAEVVAPRGQSLQNSGDGAGPGSLFDLENVQVLQGRSEEQTAEHQHTMPNPK